MAPDTADANSAGPLDRHLDRHPAGPLDRWAAITAGTLLGVTGLRRGGLAGLALAAAGGSLVSAGAAGVPVLDRVRHSPLADVAGMLMAPDREPTTVLAAATIAVPPARLFRFWRNFANLRRLMPGLEAVEVLSETRSCWKARGPGGAGLCWHTEIDNVREDEMISWHTVDDASLPHRGTILFKPAPGERGTEVRLMIAYRPPGGQGGRAVARRFGMAPGPQARAALRTLKMLMEAGELATVRGQPHGARGWREMSV
jgi:uncharacterized membrane protein